jgi:hypothetical protein
MIKSNNHITIRNNQIFKNGVLFFETEPRLPLKDFLKASWKNLKVKYPKFYKMDEVSKLGVLAAEILLADEPHKTFNQEETGVVLSNARSTFITDTEHWNSVKDDNNFFPGPAVFVYTLPNIMIGEICIRHKLKGENAFFITEKYDEKIILQHIELLMARNKIKAAIGGWVDHSPDDYLAEMFWVTAP